MVVLKTDIYGTEVHTNAPPIIKFLPCGHEFNSLSLHGVLQSTGSTILCPPLDLIVWPMNFRLYLDKLHLVSTVYPYSVCGL